MNYLISFLNKLPYLPTLVRLNILPQLYLIDFSHLTFKNLPLLLKSLALTKLLKNKSSSLRIYLAMIFGFKTKISYKEFCAMLIPFDNLVSTIYNLSITDKKLEEDLYLCQIFHILIPSIYFISSYIGLVLKQNIGCKQIYHLFYSKGESINNYISDGVVEIRYTRFQKVLNLTLNVGKSSIIVKKNMKYACENMLVVLH